MSTKTQTTQTIAVGSVVTIPAGKRVNRAGTVSTRRTARQVTVRRVEAARNGKTRVYWKSAGVIANALI